MTFDVLKIDAPTGKRSSLLIALALVLLALMSTAVIARDGQGASASHHRYIVEFQDLPLVSHTVKKRSLAGRDSRAPGARKLDMRSQEATDYLELLAAGHEEFTRQASRALRRVVSPAFRYRIATNGMAVDLSEDEAAILAKSPLVKSISRDRLKRIQTYAGPEWIGAGQIWSGESGFSASEGENIIVGVIDSGINWDSPSFLDPTIGGYSHTNPLGETLGLCSEPGVMCNNKLIGVYDFVSDLPSTEEEERSTNGKDLSGHGSHVASIAVGNPINIPVPGKGNQTLSGVAPKANLIIYRVCHTDECPDSFTIAAIDQAIEDGVDVLNFSVGGSAQDPWRSGTVETAFLNARDAGVFVVTSAGNDGPDDFTVGSPANAPWIVGVGFATHNVGNGNEVKDLAGGDTAPPDNIVGLSLTGGTGRRVVVHARDYGFALCGVGESEGGPDCEDNLGQSNPWEGGEPFNGEIVVCDRGTYGRVEKGKNVLLAGAGGYILANTSDWGEALVADDHCLPASHIGEKDGDKLRDWLASGSGHGGSISEISVIESDSLADQIDAVSSRGPALPPVEDVLKPNLIAPGEQIYAATQNGQEYGFKGGTSMSSPHVAGAAALIKSLHQDWNVSQVVSAIETTADPNLAKNYDGSVATAHDRGTGRPRLSEAVNAGLYLEVTTDEFVSANPALGGEPRNLNLVGLVDASCESQCSFTRLVTDQMGGGSWSAIPVNFPDGVRVTVTPANFVLGNGSSRELTVDLDLGASIRLGKWVHGNIKLSAAGSSDQHLTVAVKFPDNLTISDDRNGGWQEFLLTDLPGLPDATFTSGGLVSPVRTTEILAEDPSRDDPYDGGQGVFTVWHDLPQGGLWLHAETLASTATDLDLFVGRDDNGNGNADVGEELCASTTETDIERCDLHDVSPGSYWILVQNWDDGEVGGDEVSLLHAAIAPSEDQSLAASGPGMTSTDETLPLRVSWDNVNALPGEQFLGAVGVGSSRDTPNDIGVIPVIFNRTGIAAAETFPMMNGTTQRLALDANDVHDRLFIDVPPSASSLTVFVNGADEVQSNGLKLELKRLSFAEGLSMPPFAAPAAGAPTLVSASGVGGVGPSITVIGVESGRWYAVLTNNNDSPSAIEARATVEFQGTAIAAQRGLWEPGSRPGLGQGYEYNQGGSSRALVWYTYDEHGLPAWYIAGNPVVSGNIWTADLRRFTNDGSEQQSVPVGQVSISRLAENDAMFSWTLFGLSGTDRMQPISPPTCPQIDGAEKNYTGLWYRGIDGLGGASILVSATTQAQIHYLFDDDGNPRWLYAQDIENPEPTNGELPMFQFSGYCAVCESSAVSSEATGVLQRSFDSESAGSWTVDYLFNSPLSGSANRMDQIEKLTDPVNCR